MYKSKQIISLPSYCEKGFCMYDGMGGDLQDILVLEKAYLL